MTKKKSYVKNVNLGLTFDDILLIPEYSEVLPKEVDISTYFSRNIRLNIPYVSAAMDTVTESRLAIAIAKLGGIGVIHKNMSIEQQAKEVLKVKRSENAVILEPYTLLPDSMISDAKKLMDEHKIGGIPIVDDDRNLLGMVTNRDIRSENNQAVLLAKIMTPMDKLHVLKAKTPNVDNKKAEEVLLHNKIEKLPIINDEGILIGLITYKDIKKIKDNPMACKDKKGRLCVAAAVGISVDVEDRVSALVKSGVDAIVLDTAHGHSKKVLDVLTNLKNKFGQKIDIVVGNVATANAAKKLVELGADAVKVGIGPGSICTTRRIAGIGVPQIKAIQNCAKAIWGSEIPVIADGGIKDTGDVVKAIAFGASCVMMGNAFAGTDESPGETITKESRKYKEYRGMGSVEAMAQGSKDRYFQDAEDDIKKLVPEGVSGMVPAKGPLKDVIHQYVGGLRAGMGYVGAKNIEALREHREFVQITAAGIRESHVHDIIVTKESSNYTINKQ